MKTPKKKYPIVNSEKASSKPFLKPILSIEENQSSQIITRYIPPERTFDKEFDEVRPEYLHVTNYFQVNLTDS